MFCKPRRCSHELQEILQPTNVCSSQAQVVLDFLLYPLQRKSRLVKKTDNHFQCSTQASPIHRSTIQFENLSSVVSTLPLRLPNRHQALLPPVCSLTI